MRLSADDIFEIADVLKTTAEQYERRAQEEGQLDGEPWTGKAEHLRRLAVAVINKVF